MSFSKIGFAAISAAVLMSTFASAPAVAEDRRMRIINDTRVTMTQFYASNSSRTSWEEDILGRRVLNAGESVVMNIDDGSGACLFDFKAVFADGDVVIRERINVCTETTYRYSD